MKNYFLFSICALFMFDSSANGGAPAKARELLAKSPSSGIKCVLQRRPEGGGLIYLIDSSGDEIEIYNTGRYVEVKWSSSDDYFALIDHSTGYSADVKIFSCRKNNNKEKQSIELLYQTPLPGSSDVHWSVLSWNMKNGSIKIKCKYSTSGDPDKHLWQEKVWRIPIFIP